MTDQEINEAVARKLGTWARIDPDPDCSLNDPAKPSTLPAYPSYCTDIAAAWEIFSTIKRMGSIYRTPDSYWCSFATVPERTEAQADTAPMAICLAFLKLP